MAEKTAKEVASEAKAISIELIKKLKELSGVGLTDAKNALIEAKGDFDAADRARVKAETIRFALETLRKLEAEGDE